MHSISPERAMARHARRSFITGMVILLIGLLFVAIGVLFVVIPVARAPWYSTLKVVTILLGALAVVSGGVLVGRALMFPVDNQFARHMADIMAPALDARYTFVRNISRRGLGYLDAVLVGPNGALVFYFFHRPGDYLCEGNVWYRRHEGRLRPAAQNPTHEVVKDVRALRDVLRARNLGDMPVYAVVVIAGAQTRVETQQPVVPVVEMQNVVLALKDSYFSAERAKLPWIDGTIKAIMQG